METSLYSITIPVFIKSLGKLLALLDKATTLVSEKGMTEEALLDSKLAPDMFPFKKQVQVACDQAKAFAARLNGEEPVAMEDTEMTIAALKARVQKTIDLVNAVSASDVDAKEDNHVHIKYFPGKYVRGFDYATEYVLPNFFFHFSMVYAILRNQGSAIGKGDFIALTLNDGE